MKALIFDFDWVIHDTFEFHRNKIEEYFKIDFTKQDLKNLSNWSIFSNTNEKMNNAKRAQSIDEQDSIDDLIKQRKASRFK